MKIKLSVLVIICLIISSFNTYSQATDEELISTLISNTAKAWTTFPKTLNKEDILQYYSKDFIGVNIQIDETSTKSMGSSMSYSQTYSDLSTAIDTWVDYIALNNVGFLYKLWPYDIKIKVSNNLAFAYFWADFKVSSNGVIIYNSQRLTTYILIKENETWKIYYSNEIENLHDPDYCFPLDSKINLSNGKQIEIQKINKGDTLQVYNIEEKTFKESVVDELVIHEDKQFPLKTLTFCVPSTLFASIDNSFVFDIQKLKATQNHPVFTEYGIKPISDLRINDKIYYYSETLNEVVLCEIISIENETTNKVYNIKLKDSNNYFVNNVLVEMK